MGKSILLVSATAKEIAAFIDYFHKSSQAILKNNVDILISGIGLTAAAYHLTKQLAIKNYDLVIQAGVAGCFDANIHPGSVVVVKQDTIADQSVIEMKKLKTLFDLKLVPHSRYPFKNEWLVNPYQNIIKLSGLKTVKGISVNQISVSKQMINFYREKFNPVTESMEGAALHYVCLMENVRFLQIRSISNYIGERNKKKWDMKNSITSLNQALINTINNY